MATHKHALLSALLLALLLLGGCAAEGGNTELRGAGQSPAASLPAASPPRALPALRALEPAGLSALPSPSAALALLAPRSSSITKSGSQRTGAQFEPALPASRVSVNGSLLDFAPISSPGLSGLRPLAFACYSFDLSGYTPGEPGILRLAWQPAPDPQALYLGLADFSEGRWVWRQAELVTSITLGDLSANIGPAGQFLLVVALQGPAGATLKTLSLEANNLPTAVLQLDHSAGTAPLQVKLDASASDAGGDWGDEIMLYEWDYDGDGVFDFSGSAPIKYNSYQLGEFHPALRITDKRGNQATASQTVLVSQANLNRKPVAALSVTPSPADVDQPVLLDASASSDPDLDITDYQWDLDGDGSFELDSGLESSVTHVFAVAPPSVGVRVSDSRGNSADASASVSLQPDPVPAVVSRPIGDSIYRQFAANYIFTLDASGSHDLYGSIVNYAWDTDEDGIYETDTGTSPVLHLSFPHPGYHKTPLRITDDDGHSAVILAYYSIYEDAGQSVAGSGDPGTNCSLAEVDGCPALSFRDSKSDVLKYVRALDSKGSQWGSPVLVDAVKGSGYNTKLLVAAGHPVIGYQRDYFGPCYFVRALDADGQAWGLPQQLSSYSVSAGFGLLAGRPMLCYMGNGAADFRLAADDDGMAWGDPVDLGFDYTDTQAEGLSLTEVDGRPAVSSLGPYGNLHYVRASTADGSAWPSLQSLSDPLDNWVLNGGRQTSLQVVDGHPAIAYICTFGGSSHTGYLRAGDADGDSWGATQLLEEIWEPNLHQGYCSSMAVIAGKPVIASYNFGYDDLLLYRAQDADGLAWEPPQIVASTGDVGWQCCLSEIDGRAAIGCDDFKQGSLLYLRLEH